MDTVFTTISANVYHFYMLDFREKREVVYMLSLISSLINNHFRRKHSYLHLKLNRLAS